MLEVVAARCAGLDVHKRTVVACLRTVLPDQSVEREIRSFSTMPAELIVMADWLRSEQVTVVAMEATGVYWWPVHLALEGRIDRIIVGNARHMSAVPGKKTDVKDSVWIADLAAHGLIAPSFIPPIDIRELRAMTRYRRRLTELEGQQIQRIDKFLESTGIKIGAVMSDTLCVSGRAMLDALIAGERDPDVLADLAKRRLRQKIPQLRLALDGAFSDHHGTVLAEQLRVLDSLRDGIARMSEQLDLATKPFERQLELLQTIPGIGPIHAQTVLAETGTDMTRFPSPAHLASWAGLCPGNHESAGKHRSGRTRHGNKWLRTALVQAAWSASHTNGSYLQSQFYRIARRAGRKKAAVAVAHSMIVAIWHMLTKDVAYNDLGGDYFDNRNDPEREIARHVARLEALGKTVTIN